MEHNADSVLEGGGVKGIALVGALEVLEERGYRFKRVAGAIVEALVAAGAPVKTLVDIIGSSRYPDFRDGLYYTRSKPGRDSCHDHQHHGTLLTKQPKTAFCKCFATQPKA